VRALLFVFALLVLVAAVAGTTYAIVMRTRPANQPPATQAVPMTPKPVFMELDPFTVTVRDTHTDRILYVGLTLKLEDVRARDRLREYLPEVRSALLVLLSEQRPEALQTAEGKLKLAARVREALNAGIARGQVEDVLFHAFVVQ